MICAAGSGSDSVDTTSLNFPARLPHRNIISVAATTADDSPARYTNYGPASVDLAAPTDFMMTSLRGYTLSPGTSQATAVVTGVVALVWAQVPNWRVVQIRQHLLDNVRPSPYWTALVSSGGIVDMEAVLKILVFDNDRDGIPNDLDTDDDSDGVLDHEDSFPTDPNESIDTDDDGIGNNTDQDDDGDSVVDIDDWAPLNPFEQYDTDGDGTGSILKARIHTTTEPHSISTQHVSEALTRISMA